MNLNPFNAGVVASTVWSNAPRTLSSLYNSGYTAIGGVGLILAASASVSYPPAGANILRAITITRTAGAAGTCQILFSNGVTTQLIQSVNAGITGFASDLSTNFATYAQITNNDAANFVTYSYAGWDIA